MLLALPFRMLLTVVLFFSTVFLLYAETEGVIQIHVDPDGNDANVGSIENPLATPLAARDRLRELRSSVATATSSFEIILHGGIYTMSESLHFEASDSGTADTPVVWRSAEGETARLVGGLIIDGFTPVADPDVLPRLPDSSRGHVLVSDLKSQGIDDFGSLQMRGFSRGANSALELFINGERQTLARYPNDGWLTIESLPDGKDGDKITCLNDRMKRWTAAPDPWVYGYWFHGWAEQFLPVANINTEQREIQLGAKHGYGLRADQRFFALNLLEEIDDPGEWYLDRESGLLYLLPPENIDLNRAELIVSMLETPVIQTQDASHIKIEGLQIEACRSSGVSVRGGESVVVSRCTIRNLGRGAVSLSGGLRHKVESCDIDDTVGGISLSGGNRATLEPGGFEAVNNRITRFSQMERTYRPALSIGGVGNRVAHNLIADGPHMAISYGGNDHIIEFNEIHDVLLETDDAGAMYTGRDWTARGTMIRYNYIHHSGPQYAPAVPESRQTELHVVYEPKNIHGTSLIYFDDTSPQVTTYGNILHDGYRAILLGGGRDHLIENNVFLGGEIGIWIDARALGWAQQYAVPGGGWHMYEKLEQYNHDQPPYSTRYPRLATMLDEEPARPLGNVYRRNIFIGTSKWHVFHGHDGEGQSLEENIYEWDEEIEIDSADPIATLSRIPEGVLKSVGFEPIPIERIGPQREK
jgi:hypothetical protein